MILRHTTGKQHKILQQTWYQDSKKQNALYKMAPNQNHTEFKNNKTIRPQYYNT